MSGRRGGAVGQAYRRTEERVSVDLFKFFSCLQTMEDEPNVLVCKDRLINLLNEQQQQQRAKAASEEHLRAYKELAEKVQELEKQLVAKQGAEMTPTTSGSGNTAAKRARASSSSSTTSSDSDVAVVEEKKKEADALKTAESAKKKKKE
ncbi:unnamed protein product [Cylicostephanus goldi]|uniref:Uncharacterized protein n=1 Tax=Cylicostephanus goldi TaxID=71465 RepID=A0A3P6PX99_CYLGO|nr:unnamed protein product [Cylicostephanus goldi]